MFKSFFPNPKHFFWSAFAVFLVALAIWHAGAIDLADKFALFGRDLPELAEGETGPFLNAEKSWVYQYIIGFSLLFCVLWTVLGRQRWFGWSVLGSTFIMVFTYFSVQISVWLNNWYGDFYNLLQQALTEPGTVEAGEYYGQIITVLLILIPTILAKVLFSWFVSHYVFRWRTAMNEYYMSHWPKLRNVEGASQRVQEDTMRFSAIMQALGVRFVDAIMTLLAFLPLLWALSANVTELPLIGAVNGSLVYVALITSIFGTVLLAAVGIKLPGLEFNNQKVEASYRKELVYGEDNEDRARPPTIKSLFADVRVNNFRIYFHFMYFNLFRFAYLQGSTFVPLIALGPTIITGAITFGLYRQISNAFSEVETSFQFLVNSWTTIIDLISIHKRLVAFESVIHADDVPSEEDLVVL